MPKKSSKKKSRPRAKRVGKMTKAAKKALRPAKPEEKHGIFHKMWFSKKEDKKEKPAAMNAPVEKKEAPVKIDTVKTDNATALILENLAEIRRQNEELRKGYQLLYEKLDEIMKSGSDEMVEKDTSYNRPDTEESKTEKKIIGNTIIESNAEKSSKEKGEKEEKESRIKEPQKKGMAAKKQEPKEKDVHGHMHPEHEKIKTSMDALLDLIAQTGSIKIPDAAKNLHVNDRQVEEWAHVLEEHGLIDVHYPTFGKPVLKKKGAQNAR